MAIVWFFLLLGVGGRWLFGLVTGAELPACDSAEAGETVRGLIRRQLTDAVVAEFGVAGETGFDDGDYPKRHCRIPVTILGEQVFLTFSVEWQNRDKGLYLVHLEPADH